MSSWKSTESIVLRLKEVWEAASVGCLRFWVSTCSFCGGAGGWSASEAVELPLPPRGPRGPRESSRASSLVACAPTRRIGVLDARPPDGLDADVEEDD
jgi:hypothetical protein